MVYYFNISSNFTDELLVQFFNIVNNTNFDEKIVITLSSPGGELSVFYTILYIINSNPERFEILVTEVVESSGFYLVLMADCEVNLLESASSAIYHDAFFSNVNSNDYDNKDDEFMNMRKKELNKVNRKNTKYLESLGVDDEKIARISKGKDVVFSRKEVLAMLKVKKKDGIIYGLNLNH